MALHEGGECMAKISLEQERVFIPAYYDYNT